MLLYDKKNLGRRKSGMLLHLGSSIFCHHLHAKCYGLVSKEEETVWELDSSLLPELSELGDIYCLAKLNNPKQLSVEEH